VFSLAIARNSSVDAAIDSIGDAAYVPVEYPGAVTDPDTGDLISDAQVAEVPYTAFADTPHEYTGWLVVRRVLDANTQDPLFPVWRYHPFFTNNTEPVDQADLTHRRHAICETVWSDLIDGPWAHQPSGMFAANTAWSILAAICHNLLRAAGTLTGTLRYAVARGATLRTHLINIPARLARPQRRPVLHLPAHWPQPPPGSPGGPLFSPHDRAKPLAPQENITHHHPQQAATSQQREQAGPTAGRTITLSTNRTHHDPTPRSTPGPGPRIEAYILQRHVSCSGTYLAAARFVGTKTVNLARL
jgi:hypothetical protein